MLLGLSFAIGTAIYFLPSWLGSEKQNRTSIFLLNLFLGWTLIGWVIALVWAVSKDTPAQVVVHQSQPSPISNLPVNPEVRVARLRDLRDRGLITEAEFLAALAD